MNDASQIKKNIEQIKSMDEQELAQRYGFDKPNEDLKVIFALVKDLSRYSLESIVEELLWKPREALEEVVRVFSATQPDRTLMTSARNKLEVHLSTILPYIEYRSNDSSKKISEANKHYEDSLSSIENNKQLIENRQKEIEDVHKEIEGTLQAVRDASTVAGAAVFKKDFAEEANSNKKVAWVWLGAAVLLAVSAFGLAWHFFSMEIVEVDSSILVQNLLNKIIMLSMLLGSAVWCAKNYKTNLHLYTLNNHRAQSLKTLQAFISAAADEETKNAVLLEVTKAIFEVGPTGYLDKKSSGQSSSASDLKILMPAVTKAMPKNIE